MKNTSDQPIDLSSSVRITGFDAGTYEPRHSVKVLAMIDLTIAGELRVHGCALVKTKTGFSVLPPEGRKRRAMAVQWPREGKFAAAILDAAVAAYTTLTGEQLDEAAV